MPYDVSLFDVDAYDTSTEPQTGIYGALGQIFGAQGGIYANLGGTLVGEPPGEPSEEVEGFDPLEAVDDLVVGLHNVFIYNGLTINDHDLLEFYRVDDLSGFEDVDLRITDEDNTQEDGSYPGPGFYGPRTMTMTGVIVAGTYTKAIKMKRALLDAFLDLRERSLVISTKTESVFTQPTVSISCRKADKILIPSNIQPSWFVDGYYEVPFTLTLKATSPFYVASADQVSFDIGASQNAKLFPNADITVPGPNLWTLSTGTTQHSLIDEHEGNLNTADYVAVIEAAEYDTHYAKVNLGTVSIIPGSVLIGLHAYGHSTSWNDSRVELRRSNGDLLLSLNLADANQWHHAASYFSLQQNDVDNLYLQFVHDSGPVFGTSSYVHAAYIDITWMSAPVPLAVVNEGNRPAFGRFRFTGPMRDPVFVNTTNHHVLRLQGTIPAGEWIEVDTETGLVYDSAGQNRFAYFDSSSDWMRLEPGTNNLILMALDTSSASQGDVNYNHTYL